MSKLVSNDRVLALINKFASCKVAIVGDVMLDTFTYGHVERMSPEAPVPIVLINNEKQMLGGAGNVAVNIAQLGGEVSLYSRIGTDFAGNKIISLLSDEGITPALIVKSEDSYPTIEKRRIIVDNKHTVRIDRERIEELDDEAVESIIKTLTKKISNIDVLIICDYAKGVITETMAKKILSLAKVHSIPVIVDTKPGRQQWFPNVQLIAPNETEAKKMANENDDVVAGKKLNLTLKSPILVTQGSLGMTLFDKEIIVKIPITESTVVDVSGAGDTVIACCALALASKSTLTEAAYISNFAAGIAVSRPGTAAVSQDDLKAKFT